MNKVPLFAAVLGLIGLHLASSAQAAIPLLNAICPGGIEVHADEGGPVYVNGREAKLKRFSDQYYEASDSQIGVTVSLTSAPDGSARLSYTGPGKANGACTLANAGFSQQPVLSASSGAEVTCESNGRNQSECDIDTHGDIQLVRQLSKTQCVQGQNWGLYHHSVWVKDGCRAVFRNMSSGERRTIHTRPDYGMGAVGLGACNRRADADGALVTSVPVNDDVTELIVDYPDGRFLCMVRNDGQVESLTKIRRR